MKVHLHLLAASDKNRLQLTGEQTIVDKLPRFDFTVTSLLLITPSVECDHLNLRAQQAMQRLQSYLLACGPA